MAAGQKRRQDQALPTERNGAGKRRKVDGISPPQTTVKVPSYLPRSSSTAHSDLPRLPEIKDGTLEKRVFTHQGTIGSAHSHRVDLSYERLEFLGDAYLECICTRIIYDRYPHLAAGKLSQIRESLINNVALSEHAKRYNFHKRINVAHLDRKTITKVYADIFEAYVAAVIIQSPESGFATAETWLHHLWTPRLKQWDQEVAAAASMTTSTAITTADNAEEAPPTQHLRAKQDLAIKLGGVKINLDYIEERPPDLRSEKGRQTFFMGVYLTGWGYERLHLGSGTGSNKKEACHRAALQALTENRERVETIAAKKRAFDERVRAEREREAEGKTV